MMPIAVIACASATDTLPVTSHILIHTSAHWMPLHWGPISVGGYPLASTGYPSAVLVLPGFAVEYERVGLNVVVAPNIGDYSGYVGVQVRFRVD